MSDETTDASRYYPDGTVRLPDALEAWVDGALEGGKGDDSDERLSWDRVRNVVDVVLWELIHQMSDPDDFNEDAAQALLDALGHGAGACVPFPDDACLIAAHKHLLSRAHRAEAERDALRADLRSVAAHASGVLADAARRGIGLEHP